jgi:phosphoribosyl 1,2-cyclic phosphodiesterase
LRFTSLSSGSEGNALVVESVAPRAPGATNSAKPAAALSQKDPSRLLIDCGLGLKEVTRRLAQRGLKPTDLDAIFVTHEHADHISGAAKLARAADIPVFLSHGSRIACNDDFWRGVQTIEIESHARFDIGALSIHVFPVPHDAREPTQLVVCDHQHRLGVLTDVGKSTPHIESMLSGADALFLEANHDEAMLAQCHYPESLKQRIGGPFGHLSNRVSAEILQALDQSRLQLMVAAHLSRHNNSPELVTKALQPACERHVAFQVASQIDGFDWLTLAQ